MPSKRNQPTRQTQSNGIDPVLVAKRTKRHLDELERSNYAEPSVSAEQDEEEGSGTVRRGRAARQTLISDKRALNKKKSTMNVRSALLYRKNFATLLEESGISSLPSSYLSATAPPSIYPQRSLCSVCGFWGSYKCQKCAMPLCDLNCTSIHDETRCERRVI